MERHRFESEEFWNIQKTRHPLHTAKTVDRQPTCHVQLSIAYNWLVSSHIVVQVLGLANALVWGLPKHPGSVSCHDSNVSSVEKQKPTESTLIFCLLTKSSVKFKQEISF